MTSSPDQLAAESVRPVGDRREFFRRVAGYGIGTTLYKVHVLFLIPLFARYLEPAENGTLEVALFAAGLVGALVMFNLAAAATTRHVAADAADRGRVLGESMLAMTTVAAAALLISPVLALGFRFALGDLRDRYWLIVVAFLGACLSSFVGNAAYLLQLKSARRAFTVIFAGWAVLVVVLSAVFIASLDMGAMGYAAAVLLTGVVCSALCLWAVRREVALALAGTQPVMAAVDASLRYMRIALPLLPITILGWVLLLSDRRVLQATQGLAEVGQYGLAVKIASGVSVLLAPVVAAWWDQGMNAAPEDVPTQARRAIDAMVAIALVGSLILAGATLLPVDDLVGDDYGAAVRFIPVLGLCSILTSAFLIPFGLLTRHARFAAATLAYVAACVVNLGLNLALTPSYGIGGATVANLAGYVTLVGAAAWAVRGELGQALVGRRLRYLLAGALATGVSFAAMA